ncbi:MAG: serine hydrolase [Comamonadaceae bacterium]|nr:MAG: serine hydrolase [Comamonadaceae bacterium]
MAARGLRLHAPSDVAASRWPAESGNIHVVNRYQPRTQHASPPPRHWRQLRSLAAALALGTVGAAASATSAEDGRNWSARLQTELTRLDGNGRPTVGVYVRDLDTGESTSYRAGQRWYIASMVKVPVAIAVLRGIERNQFTLDTNVTLRASDYVDGAGPTSRYAVGTPLTVRFLLEQMMVLSDNTATDMLIDLVGLAEVNAVTQALVPEGFSHITTLGDVRRMIYGQLTPAAARLSGPELLALRQLRTDEERLQLLSRLTDTPVRRFKLASLDAAYAAYYAEGVNSAQLGAYGELLAKVVDGQALTPRWTAYLLALMERVQTGTRRVKAGLPAGLRFAHKTGTQRYRICDAGLVRTASPAPVAGGLPDAHQRRVLVVACARGDVPFERSEAALMQVGAALCRSGLFNTSGVTDAITCHQAAIGAAPNGGAAAPAAASADLRDR